MNVKEFLDNAVLKGTIQQDSLSEIKLQVTKSIFDSADAKLSDAILNQGLTLKDKINGNKIDPSVISSGYITEDFNNKTEMRPVIDLVQQGGGMYGIALLGYTYIMEKLGIRFYSHGGTSAGAINASFLAAIPNSIYNFNSIFSDSNNIRQATKSELLTHIITNTNFNDFMGAKGIIGNLQRRLFKNFKSLGLKVILFTTLAAFLIICFVAFGGVFRISNGLSGFELRYFDFIVGTLNILALLLLIYILLVKLFGKRFGVNTGDEFYTWVEELFALVGVRDTANLSTRLNQTVVQPPLPSDEPRLVLIASNLTHNRIVKFPERAGDYWTNPNNVCPAAYLRATMSLPFIFRTFVPRKRHYSNSSVKDKVKLKARFVDGGMLSNFPIREFHKTSGQPPRFPTFGVLLSDIGLNNREKIKQIKGDVLPKATLMQYLKSFFKTFRNFYDYEFLFSNDEIRQRVVTVDTEKFNWLDFWMDDKTKKDLFLVGVDAAIEQLDKFQWTNYRTLR